MRFTSVAVMAGSALAMDNAYSTDYATQMVTVTACPESVTNCPARSMTTSVQPMSTSTVYSTKVHTITACGPTVTNCPAHSTIVSTEMVPVNTGLPPAGAAYPGMPIPQGPGKQAYPQPVPQQGQPGSYPQPGPQAPQQSMSPEPSPETPEQPAYPQPVPEASQPAGDVPTNAPEGPSPTGAGAVCPVSSVTAITKTYTTVLTSVEYSTMQTEGPCVAATPVPQGPQGPSPQGPQGPGPQGPQGPQGPGAPGAPQGPVATSVPQGPGAPGVPKGPQGPIGTGVPVAPPASYPPVGNNPSGNNTMTPPVTAGAGMKASSVLFATFAGALAFIFA